MERKEQGYPGPVANRTSNLVVSAPTYISPGIKVKGAITADEDLHIDGYVEGSLFVGGHRVTVGEMAYIDAETVAREVVVYGAVRGNLRARDRIEIKKHASVAGDLATAKMVIEDGAYFKGRIDADGTSAQVGADLGTLLARTETKDQ
jgi:cytoskeletal protein CcmA (bactofilin family)